MSQTDCIGPMKVAMKVRRDMIAVACDSFMKMFQLGDDELVEQVSPAADAGTRTKPSQSVSDPCGSAAVSKWLSLLSK